MIAQQTVDEEQQMSTLFRVIGASIVLTLGALVSATSVAQQPAVATKPPLYERLGGLKGISLVVDDFIDRLVTNKTLNKNPAIDAGRKSAPAPYLKVQVAQLVCEVAGGPCKYTGKDMKSSHAHLNISEKEWDVMAGEFKKSLNKFKVPAAEQNELFEIVGKTKPDIVVRKG
jgi:hemoglobin